MAHSPSRSQLLGPGDRLHHRPQGGHWGLRRPAGLRQTWRSSRSGGAGASRGRPRANPPACLRRACQPGRCCSPSCFFPQRHTFQQRPGRRSAQHAWAPLTRVLLVTFPDGPSGSRTHQPAVCATGVPEGRGVLDTPHTLPTPARVQPVAPATPRWSPVGLGPLPGVRLWPYCQLLS